MITLHEDARESWSRLHAALPCATCLFIQGAASRICHITYNIKSQLCAALRGAVRTVLVPGHAHLLEPALPFCRRYLSV